MKSLVRHFLFVAAFASCCLILSGLLSPSTKGQQQQQRPQPTPTPDATDRDVVYIREVRLPITVLDKKENPVPGLTRGDFIVTEDKIPQQIISFRDEKESLPVWVGVLMDTSSSTTGQLRFEQESAKDFIYTVVSTRKDRVAFATFDDDINLRQDFTEKLDLLDKAVDGVKKPGKQTALYDAIWQFCDEKMRGVPGRRVLVIITDGDDTYSRATLREAIDIAQRTETIIFAISTKAGMSGSVPGVEMGQVKDKGDKDLVKLCEETGGAAFFTGDRIALERSFKKISMQLRSQYLITYKPLNDRFDGSTRRIEVKLTSKRDGYKIVTRRSYPAVSDSVLAAPR
ncbi:MAG TPA: VWA domain-containing protein [Pyrinomonadaceae bacterium]|jgi:Ca-activated chloride channel family protein